MKLTLEERETNLFFNEADKTCRIMSYNSRLNNRLKELSENRPEEVKTITVYNDPENNGFCYEFPAYWLRINPPRVSTMTEEQKRVAGDRLRALNEAKRND